MKKLGTVKKPAVLSSEARQGLEWAKRELLQLEDLKIGNGPLTAWERKASADFKVRYSIAEPIECFYNCQRLHQPLGYRSPEEFEKMAGGL